MNPLLSLEPQNRDMALIRCPNCDTLHDLDGALFAEGPRRVRCATCRMVWEADDPMRDAGPINPLANLAINAGAARYAPPPAAEPLDTREPLQALETQGAGGDQAVPASQEAGGDISPEELEALFAEETAGSSGESVPAASAPADAPPAETSALEDLPAFDAESLARDQDAAIASASEDATVEARARRREKRLRATDAHHRPIEKPSRFRPIAAMAMAAGLGTFATLVALRHETVRLVPETAPLFEAFGLGITPRGLDIRDVHGRLVAEENRETLEITGTIVNPTRQPMKIPVLRLSIRNQAGQDIYVWTATADQPELAPGETTQFRRRLASPPAESFSVMVRFVAKDDIVAAIR
ncbi:MAG: FxLYD domain-containing protein [Rhabdaerophilum calidifontis]